MLVDGPTHSEEKIVSDHFGYLKDLNDRGVVILAGRTLNTDESSFGIVVFQAESTEAAQALMRSDPAVKNGVMRAELFPYRIALMAER
jgi:uncharacterized protein YciI